MRVLVLTEYYPRSGDPVSGVWVHRQALAARAEGAQLRVLVLHRPLPSLASIRALDLPRARDVIRQQSHASIDGIDVEYLRYLAPPRPMSYGSWGAWAAPLLRRRLAALRAEFPFELIHAHYAVPAGDAARRAAPQVPLLVSVHGHDVYGAGRRFRALPATLSQARLVLANSAGTARRCVAHGARATRVVHLGTDLEPMPVRARAGPPALVTVANLVARKRHEDVIRALALLRERWPELRYVIVGDGPERQRLERLAHTLSLESRVEFHGRLAHRQAVELARQATLFVLPSVEEAFGVGYVEAMGGGVVAIGAIGEDGPAEIAAAGGGIELVAPRDPRALAARIDQLLSDHTRLAELAAQARDTVEREFTWRRCGRQTVEAYEEVLRG